MSLILWVRFFTPSPFSGPKTTVLMSLNVFFYLPDFDMDEYDSFEKKRIYVEIKHNLEIHK